MLDRLLARRARLGWASGAAVAIAAGAYATIGLAAAGPAAATPTPTYHAGSDTATFSVSGVRDSNCVVSTGGAAVFIKPGDALTLNSDLAGLDLSGLSIGTGSVLGLNVHAVLDGNTKKPTALDITGGKSLKLTGLSSGAHTLTWTATGIPVASGLLGTQVTLPLSSSELQSGAKLSWAGHIYVTNTAPECRLAVLTPGVGASVGPVHVSLPPVKITVPVKLPTSVPSLPGTGGGTGTTHRPGSGGGKKPTTPTTGSSSSGLTAVVPGITVPEEIVPQGSGGLPAGSSVGGGNGLLGDSNGQLGNGYATSADGSRVRLAAVPGSTTDSGKKQTVDLASSDPDAGTGQLPVLLAILAVITLALVAGTYARMFLLRRPTS